MTITYTIPGATLLDQLSPTTLDGLPNDNAQDDCVAASIAEALHILTGRTFDGDELTDAVYGANYTGFESAHAYIAYCTAQGVSLSVHSDTQAGLVATIHREVAAGHPVLVTMPSMWGTAPANPLAPSGTTHVGVAVGVGPSEIRVMNPWHGFYQDQPDAWWQARLCYGQVWPLRNVTGGTPMTTSIPTGWSDDGTTLRAPGNTTPIVGAIRAYILAHSWDPADVPEGWEMTTAQVEFSDVAHGGGIVQYFRFSAIAVTTALGAYRLYAGAEVQAARAVLNVALSQIAQLKQQLAAAQAAPTPPAPPPVVDPSAAANAAKAAALDGLFALYGVK